MEQEMITQVHQACENTNTVCIVDYRQLRCLSRVMWQYGSTSALSNHVDQCSIRCAKKTCSTKTGKVETPEAGETIISSQ